MANLTLKHIIRKSGLKAIIDTLTLKQPVEFKNSPTYWETRYQVGGNSGAGSYGRLAEFKAEIINKFVADRNVFSIIEFGCGDGNQLKIASYPKYLGVDISETVIQKCLEIFEDDKTKEFILKENFSNQTADLTLSLDVIYHLIEYEIFQDYMKLLFDSSEKYVIVYASNKNEATAAKHVHHRKFTDWVADSRKDFSLLEHIPNRYPFDENNQGNTSFAEFYIYEKQQEI